MSRIPELIWATSFIITSSLSITYDIVSLTESFLIALAITIVLTYESRHTMECYGQE